MNRYKVVRTTGLGYIVFRARGIELVLLDTETNAILFLGVLPSPFTERELKTHKKIMNVTARLLNRGNLRVRSIVLEHLAKLHEIKRAEVFGKRRVAHSA